MAFTPIHHTSYPFISPLNFTNSLTNKTVLVTGASKGLGRAISLAFAAAGASIVGVARTSSELDSLISEIKQKFKDVETVGIVADLLIGNSTSPLTPYLHFNFHCQLTIPVRILQNRHNQSFTAPPKTSEENQSTSSSTTQETCVPTPSHPKHPSQNGGLFKNSTSAFLSVWLWLSCNNRLRRVKPSVCSSHPFQIQRPLGKCANAEVLRSDNLLSNSLRRPPKLFRVCSFKSGNTENDGDTIH